MEKQKGKNGSPAHASGGNGVKKQQTKDSNIKKVKTNKIVKVCIVLLFLFIIVFNTGVIIYAKSVNEIGVIYSNASYFIKIILGEIVTALVSYIFGVYLPQEIKRVNLISILKAITMVAIILIPITLFAFPILSFLNIGEKLIIDKKEETKVINVNVMNRNATTYDVKKYIFNEDPFLENKEQYVEVSLEGLSEDEIDKYVIDVLLDSVKNKKEKQTKIPSIYIEDIDKADKQYIIYLKQVNIPVLYERRIDDLKFCMNMRIEADEEYKDPENERLIGVYYIDLADEYLRDKKVNKAVDCFEEASKWGMISIQTKLANDDYNFDEALDVLSKSSKKMNQLENIGDKHKENLEYVYKIYNSIRESH